MEVYSNDTHSNASHCMLYIYWYAKREWKYKSVVGKSDKGLTPNFYSCHLKTKDPRRNCSLKLANYLYTSLQFECDYVHSHRIIKARLVMGIQ